MRYRKAARKRDRWGHRCPECGSAVYGFDGREYVCFPARHAFAVPAKGYISPDFISQFCALSEGDRAEFERLIERRIGGGEK